ncbi:MAG: sigma-70 family RNA polymerase sigma factor [Thermoleophilaceae bacterium]|nr:sigma-70 family RNA polymerase sigma factor [Thermoleophilaceae bacterium]
MPQAAATDIDLITAAQAGEPAALGQLFDRHSVRAYRVARSICRDHTKSEDAVQDAFLAVWRGRAAYDSERGEVRAWLLTAVRNRALDLVRRESRHDLRRAGEQWLENRSGFDDVAGTAVDRVYSEDELRALLNSLPVPQREAIVLAYYGQLSCTEIANRLGIPIGTVKGRLRLGLEKLRGVLESPLEGIHDEVQVGSIS